MLYIILMHISHFMLWFFCFFFLLMTLLAVYFIFVLDYGNDVRQKANSYFLIWLQNGFQSSGDNCNINNTFGPGTAYKCIVQWWFKKFCKGDESLKDEEHSGRPLEGNNDQLGGSSKLILFNYMRSCQRTQHWLFHGRSAFEANWKREWSSISLLVSLVSWLQIKESSCWSVIFSYFTQQRTIFHSSCDEQGKADGIWQLAVTSSVEGLSKRLQSTSQSQTCTKKKKGPSHCLVFYCRSDPLQLSESWWNHSIWEVGSTNRWGAPKTAMPEAGTGQQKRSSSSPQQHPTRLHDQCFKSWMNWVSKFCLISRIHLTSCQPATTSSRISTTFCRESTSTPSRR